ncbi:MAG: carbohydrate ABC transporter substrate-binding protein [Deltaproteobacteria bacterium]|nr:carbohydrate ABC transporter substrate-binding protein [Deltaproteobacteria bacterium]MBN2673756.1 carbohydrate ABC transporter substrate-binding protein [Deltaproteobacteria bacterium]
MKVKFSILFVLLLSMVLLAGCDDGDSGDDNGDTDDPTDSDSSTDGQSIEIFSWWTSGGEAEALQALIDAFNDEYPEVDVVNVSAILGHGQDAREELANRMAANDPPDTFQLGPRDFQNWVEYNGDVTDNRLEPLDSLFATEGWAADYPAGVLEVLKYNDLYYAVPLNMHRQNTLLYNMDLVPTPPTTMDEFLTLMADLNTAGTVPVAVSATGGWTLEIIFFSMMAGTAGAEYHRDFFTGALDLTDAANLEGLNNTIANYNTLMSYANADAGAIGWDQAADMLMAGTAAMYIHGDWAKGYYVSNSWIPGTDFDVMAVPGSENEFIYNVDTFALCNGAANRENAMNFLRVIGGATAQEAFNKVKGSTPVHPDVDISTWDSAATSTFNDYESATILHNVEIHQFSVPDATVESGAVGLADKLLELYQGTITDAELVTWITTNYVVATQ